MLAVKDVLDDGELEADRGGRGRRAVALQRGEDLGRLLVAAFTDEEAGRVGEVGTYEPDEAGEDCEILGYRFGASHKTE